jgi:branched-chain amino acid transport system substrate-binding protein
MMQNGILLAVDEWNSQGGILDHHLETMIYETDCTFESGRQAARRALDEGVQFIVGPLCSEAAVAAAVVAEPAGVVLMVPAAIHPLVTVNAQGQTRQGVFSLSYSRRWQAQAAAVFARDTLKVDRVALLSEANDQYTRELATNFAAYFGQAGGKITYQTDYQLESLNFLELSNELQETEAQLLYLPGDEASANRITAQLTSTGQSSPLFLGSDAWEAETLDRSLVQGSYFPIHFSSQSEQPHLQLWLEKYQATFATEPSTLAVLGYDALHVLAQALQEAQTVEPALVATILEEGVFEAVTGPLTFAPDHTPLKPVPFIQVEEGELKYVTSILPETIRD